MRTVTAAVRRLAALSASSSTPATVTVCGVSQSDAAKVRVSWRPVAPPSVSTTAASVSALATVTVTALAGRVCSSTVKAPCPPASATVTPAGQAVRPGERSLARMVKPAGAPSAMRASPGPQAVTVTPVTMQASVMRTWKRSARSAALSS